MRRTVAGSAVGLVATLALALLLLPLRDHLSVATTALVLVVPVVLGVVTGGFVAGIVSVVGGFVAYDLVFIRPYYTLSVGAAQNWAALVVYVVVMVLVARVVSGLDEARAASGARALNARRLYELSELLLAERPLEELGRAVVDAVRGPFGLDGVALLLTVGDRLEVVATSGEPIAEADIGRVQERSAAPVPLVTASGDPDDGLHVLALATAGQPVGLLVIAGPIEDRAVREVLPTLANHLAVALQRAQLHAQAHRAQLLEEVDHLRRSLVGAVSHDLRTPLATIKVASTTLLAGAVQVSGPDAQELYSLIDAQTDRLTRLVTNLLDLTRLESGVLEIHREPIAPLDLIGEAVAAVRPSMDGREVDVDVPPTLPLVAVDPVLIGQVLTNLLDNADRHAPPGRPIVVAARPGPSATVELSVADEGPGVPEGERDAVFERFVRFDTGGRAGLGLTLAKMFVESHGGTIRIEDNPGGGARFVVTVPADPGSLTGRPAAVEVE